MNATNSFLIFALIGILNFASNNLFFEKCLNITKIENYKEFSLKNAISYRTDQSSGLKIALFKILPISLIIVVFFTTKTKILQILCIPLLACIFIKFFLQGQRSLLFYFIFLFFGLWHLQYSVSKAQFIFILFSIISLFVFNSISRHARNLSEFVDSFNQSQKTNFLYFLKPPSEFRMAQNLHLLIEKIDKKEAKLLKIKGLYNEILNFIPRIIPIQKDLSLGEKFASEFYPKQFKEGAGYGLFIVQEGYWFFGSIGVFISFFLLGMLALTIFNWMQQKSSFLGHFLYLSFCIQCLIFGVRTGILGSLKAWLIFALPTFFIFKIFKSR